MYWGKNQPISYEDGEDYVPPDTWPSNYELIYRPIAIRIMGLGLQETEPEENYAITYLHQYIFFTPQDIGDDRATTITVTVTIIPDYQEGDSGPRPYKYSPDAFSEEDSNAVFYPEFDNTNDTNAFLEDIRAAIESGALFVPTIVRHYALDTLRYDQLLNETHYRSDEAGDIFQP